MHEELKLQQERNNLVGNATKGSASTLDKCSVSQVIMKMEIRTKITCYMTPFKMSYAKDKNMTGKDVGKEKDCNSASGPVNLHRCFRK